MMPRSPGPSRGCRAGSAAAAALDWAAALPALADARSLIAIGRGPTLAIAREAALKLKETCNMHAEAFSGAEVLHGPVALIANRYPVLMFMAMDETAPGLGRLAEDLVSKGAAVYLAGADSAGAARLPALAPDHPDVDAVCLIQSFYGLALKLAAAARRRRRPSPPPPEDHPHDMIGRQFAIAADWVFDGAAVRPDHAVVVEDGTIVALMPRLEVPGQRRCKTCPTASGWRPASSTSR
jgi:hypothetical protein